MLVGTYFGEDAKQYSNGVLVGTEGSWEAGVDGALPGIVMEAEPQVGDLYRQEYYKGVAEDMAEVLSTTGTATVPYGTFFDCVVTKDFSPLEKKVVENKWYARGVGLVKSLTVVGPTETSELVKSHRYVTSLERPKTAAWGNTAKAVRLG